MSERPSGTVTFLFTDIEGSTKLLREAGEAYDELLATHRKLLRDAFAARDGHEVDTQGDAFLVAFARASDAVLAAVEAQLALSRHDWPAGRAIRVRMGLHTGEARLGPEGYTGLSVHHGARVGSAAHGGQILASGATLSVCADDLGGDLRLVDLGEYRLKDLAAPEHLYQVQHPDLPAGFPKLRTLDARPHNLPVQPTPLVGRENELGAAREMLLKPDVRLVTLTGPGGIGKTRLAVQVGAEVAHEFEHGVWLVQLAALTDHSLVVPAIAEVLGVQEAGGRPLLEALKEWLASKRIVLVLDNFEQVTEAADDVAALLGAGAGVKMLVTSRHVLRLRGEHELPVLPLAPLESVALFVERAQAARPSFELTADNETAVREICTRLDGLPLAIELAAARIKLFQPQAMLDRLSKSLQLLTGGARDLPDRHKTLRDAIAWSYDLLSEAEQALLRRLAVFAGGCTIEAVETVCSEGLDADVLDSISSLVDKSLLRQQEQPDGELRFVMLVTIREFAGEMLEQDADADEISARHFQWFVDMAETGRAELDGPNQVSWLERLSLDHDNLRAAMSFSLDSGNPARALYLAAVLEGFWRVRGHYTEGRTWISRARAATDRADHPSLMADALRAEGILAQQQGDHTSAEMLVRDALAIDRASKDLARSAKSLNILAVSAQRAGRDDATHLYEESLDLLRQLGDKARMAETLNNLGSLAHDRGDFAAARSTYEEALVLFRELRNTAAVAAVTSNLGVVATDQGDYSSARALYEESLAARTELGDRSGVASVLGNIGNLCTRTSEYETAHELFEQSLQMHRELENKSGIALALLDLADLARRRGDYENAIAHGKDGLAQARELGDRWVISIGLAIQAWTESDRAEHLAARALADELRQASDELADRLGRAQALTILATVARRSGQLEDAPAEEALAAARDVGDRELLAESLQNLASLRPGSEAFGPLEEALPVVRGLGDRRGIAAVLEQLAAEAARASDHDRAARLLGAADAIRKQIGAPIPPADALAHEDTIRSVRDALGGDALASAMRQGEAAEAGNGPTTAAEMAL